MMLRILDRADKSLLWASKRSFAQRSRA